MNNMFSFEKKKMRREKTINYSRWCDRENKTSRNHDLPAYKEFDGTYHWFLEGKRNRSYRTQYLPISIFYSGTRDYHHLVNNKTMLEIRSYTGLRKIR
jgi:hypothetical protein